MKWQLGRRSSNIEDRRGIVMGRGVQLGGGAAILGIILTLLGVPQSLVEDVVTGPGEGQVVERRPTTPEEDQQADMVSSVLGSTEDVWAGIFRKSGESYAPPKLVLFTEAVRSACGFASAAVGPFYCPADRKVYLDLTFFRELDKRFGAPGDFAQAYVVAHEVAHHVQTLTGISERVQSMKARGGEAQANQLSVRQELQADCLAGVWAHHAQRARDWLEKGDLEEALGAATAIGDDTLQRRARGHVQPETFTHGTSQQRVQWFRRGMESGQFDSCDTFTMARL